MSAFAAQLAVNLEPVYAILLAIVLLGEQHELSAKFYLGVAIILGAVLAYPLFGPRRRIEHPEVLATAESKVIEWRWPGGAPPCDKPDLPANRSEEHTSELQSLMRISYAVFCLKKKNK